ncbi:type IV toxin-antitoxin system YeeU family antitoxin [Buttiauxella sp. S04-F03]|uniref:type IV toxin-antitoxin system YeeU family antitoxin n=1 Tax=Buttiauxella sp. S04-F03 TaxID=2904525 RepID=UPI001E4785CE|nr:type IV toxin-antitoxin system YeeU family antitoxin [Buttiauxella sp. S04-F03]MCE0814112.1 type IV toxin-antitoxin system YeeU family antitoxin [Buttiauxella sp. S04-F03]
MQSTTLSDTSAENASCLQWGLKRNITPCFGACLVQEGNHLYFLADRAGFNGSFSDDEALRLDQTFPLMMKQLEQMLTTEELNPRSQRCVTLYHNGLTCEADTLGSHGYVYITIYPQASATR